MRPDCDKMYVSAVNSRQVRFIVVINDNEFVTEWEVYNPVNITNKVQALVEQGHKFSLETK